MKFIEYVRSRRHTRTQKHIDRESRGYHRDRSSRRGMKYYNSDLHGDKYYAWFDSTFGLQPITINTNKDNAKDNSKSQR